MRDDFPEKDKQTLAKRVGMHCSNPGCDKPTAGPCEDPAKALNIGVAAHITAASLQGPRYDASLSQAERCSIENGIWLCQNCAKLIDSDKERFPVSRLRDWKTRAEKAALNRVETTAAPAHAAESADGDYWQRRRDTVEQALASFESIHALFFKICIDYMSVVEVLWAGLPATADVRERYYQFIKEIGVKLHEMHIIEGRLRVAGAGKAVTALQQYRLQATEVNCMLRLQQPKMKRQDVEAAAEELFRRKDRFYEELANALKSV
jgi:hypothetical protein